MKRKMKRQCSIKSKYEAIHSAVRRECIFETLGGPLYYPTKNSGSYHPLNLVSMEVEPSICSSEKHGVNHSTTLADKNWATGASLGDHYLKFSVPLSPKARTPSTQENPTHNPEGWGVHDSQKPLKKAFDPPTHPHPW